MSAASNYEVSKNWLGHSYVNYECPHCRERLRSRLSEAGQTDNCPACQRAFTVPGAHELNEATAAKQAADDLAAKVKAERHQAKQARRQEQAAERERIRKTIEEEARQSRERRAAEEQLARASAEVDGDQENSSKAHRPWRRRTKFILAAVAVFAIYSFVRGSDLRSKLDRCESKDIVTARVSYAGLIETDTVIFDVRDGSSGARRIDPVHLLMQFADELELYAVRKVVLAKDGRERFYITGDDLRPLAESYANGGRTWAFNNLPSRVRRMDGSRAYSEWSGGWLGVAKGQAEDMNDFIREWTGW